MTKPKTAKTPTPKTAQAIPSGPPEKKSKKAIKPEDLAVIFHVIGSLGAPSVPEIREVLQGKLNWQIHKATLTSQVESLRAKGLISKNNTRRDEVGRAVDTYNWRGVDNAKAVSVASFNPAMIPKLLATDQSQKIVAMVAEETSGGKREIQYNDYYELAALYVTTDCIYGASPPSQATMAVRALSGVKAVDNQDVYFDRDFLTGLPQINSDQWKKYIERGLRTVLKLSSGSAGSWNGFGHVLIDSPYATVESLLPVVDSSGGGKGKGLTKAETVLPGALLTVTGRVPAKGIAIPEDFVRAAARYAPTPIRGWSPARGNRSGKGYMLRFWWRPADTAGDWTEIPVSVELPERIAKHPHFVASLGKAAAFNPGE